MTKETKHKIVVITMIIFIISYIGSLIVFRMPTSVESIWSRKTMDLILAAGFFILSPLLYLKTRYAG